MDEQVQSERADGLKSVVSGLAAEGKILSSRNNNRRPVLDKRIIDHDEIQPGSRRNLLYTSDLRSLPEHSTYARIGAGISPVMVEKRGSFATRSGPGAPIYETMSK
jgi:hypothetical protein